MACKWLIKGYYGTGLVQHTHDRLMSTYLDTSKIQAAGRLSLSPSALRNLNIAAGDSVEIFFDETLGGLLILPVRNKNSTAGSSGNIRGGVKGKKR